MNENLTEPLSLPPDERYLYIFAHKVNWNFLCIKFSFCDVTYNRQLKFNCRYFLLQILFRIKFDFEHIQGRQIYLMHSADKFILLRCKMNYDKSSVFK